MAQYNRIGPYNEFETLTLKNDDYVFVLSGAGVSVESGLATFRDGDGLWEKHRIEDVATPEAWRRDPELVWRFYSARRKQASQVEPNAAHRALAQMEEALQERFLLCTQNVDNLHERAGNKRVLHMHGELFMSRCEDPDCMRAPFSDERYYETKQSIARCECGARILPHICWFGEVPFHMNAIMSALNKATVFVTVGSSGAVYPAASFVSHVKNSKGSGPTTIYVGPEPPDNAYAFDQCRLGKATEAIPRLFSLR
ncbi:MAG: NAD-dependent deacylase [Myxococcales bacterium]|nr:MAG: NAD-dependent deacylase [Myxococcales bacterium]